MNKQNKQLTPTWDFIEIAFFFNQIVSFIGEINVGAFGLKMYKIY